MIDFIAMNRKVSINLEPGLYSFHPDSATGKTLLVKMVKSIGEKDIPITAVFAISDVMAIGAIRAIRDKGLSVPDDISITGFDGTTLADYYNPKIVSIRQHHKDLAVRSVELLFNMIDLNKPATHEIIPFELTVGESVKKIL